MPTAKSYYCQPKPTRREQRVGGVPLLVPCVSPLGEATANSEGESLDIYILAHLEVSSDRITKALNAQFLSK
ncbi:hypothetical protein [Nostoc sp.]|uniref:hypothetical protein n=1 Tax=Nostoc sp. TaxID=1180 RepID=UPI003FA573E2